MKPRNETSAAAAAPSPEETTETTAAAPLLKWRVEMTPPGENALTVGECRCARGAIVNLTEARAKALNGVLPGALKLAGV